MKVRYIIFYFVFVIQNIFCWYYILCFFYVYEEVFDKWIVGSITSLLISNLIEVSLPFVATILRFFAIRYKI